MILAHTWTIQAIALQTPEKFKQIQLDSSQGPLQCQCNALPTELFRQAVGSQQAMQFVGLTSSSEVTNKLHIFHSQQLLKYSVVSHTKMSKVKPLYQLANLNWSTTIAPQLL